MRPFFHSLAVVGCLVALGGVACGDGDGLTQRVPDSTPPQVTVVQPGAIVATDRPLFVIRVLDQGTGVVCLSITATMAGTDYSSFFRSGCDLAAGEVRVPSGLIFPALQNGTTLLEFKVSDRAGNETVANHIFEVELTDGEPPPEE
jgi:hypothetical protein